MLAIWLRFAFFVAQNSSTDRPPSCIEPNFGLIMRAGGFLFAQENTKGQSAAIAEMHCTVGAKKRR